MIIELKFLKFKEIRKDTSTVENHWFAGPVMANNEGLKNASGDWIARIDDDDIWTSNHLEDLIKYAKHTQSDFVSSSYLLKKMVKKK